MVEYKWFQIGIQLGISRHKLKEFEKEHDPLAAVVDYFLCGNITGSNPSWKSLLEALMTKHVDESGLAKRLSIKYCSQREHKESGHSKS